MPNKIIPITRSHPDALSPSLFPILKFNRKHPNSMKRSAPDYQVAGSDQKMKKIKEEDEDGKTGLMNLDENLLYEVFKHVDARTLARASCVSRLWRQTAKDERLWELICTRHWANIGCGTQQLRSVVLPLGGFRQLHSRYLWAFSKRQASSASSWAPPKIINSKPPARWGKDETTYEYDTGSGKGKQTICFYVVNFNGYSFGLDPSLYREFGVWF
ncbi:hypothetical protein V6N13_003402 [Hibiscus sabdariffa]|uniref:F-box domain-containing protein n=2 Tax=Hibiscus sabdariffa TaxID=183260 RepID=A0ABR2AW87_9ROSI